MVVVAQQLHRHREHNLVGPRSLRNPGTGTTRGHHHPTRQQLCPSGKY